MVSFRGCLILFNFRGKGLFRYDPWDVPPRLSTATQFLSIPCARAKLRRWSQEPVPAGPMVATHRPLKPVETMGIGCPVLVLGPEMLEQILKSSFSGTNPHGFWMAFNMFHVSTILSRWFIGFRKSKIIVLAFSGALGASSDGVCTKKWLGADLYERDKSLSYVDVCMNMFVKYIHIYKYICIYIYIYRIYIYIRYIYRNM